MGFTASLLSVQERHRLKIRSRPALAARWTVSFSGRSPTAKWDFPTSAANAGQVGIWSRELARPDASRIGHISYSARRARAQLGFSLSPTLAKRMRCPVAGRGARSSGNIFATVFA